MGEWERLVQAIVEEVDECIRKRNNEALTLSTLAGKLGYSEFYISRKFKEISGMSFCDYLWQRKLAFALKEVRDTSRGLLEIALDYGFSSHEAFSRSFKEAYGITPSEYRTNPIPVTLRTIIKPFDYQTQNCAVEQKIEEAMKNYDYAASGYCLDTTQSRVFYFYHDPERFWKFVRPVKKL